MSLNTLVSEPIRVNNCKDSSNFGDKCSIFDSLIQKRIKQITQIRFSSQSEAIWYYMGHIGRIKCILIEKRTYEVRSSRY